MSLPFLRSCEPESETCFSMDSLMAAGEGWLGGAGPGLRAEEINHGREELIYGSSICPAVSLTVGYYLAGAPVSPVPRAPRPWRSHRPPPIGPGPRLGPRIVRPSRQARSRLPQFIFSIDGTRLPPPRPPSPERSRACAAKSLVAYITVCVAVR